MSFSLPVLVLGFLALVLFGVGLERQLSTPPTALLQQQSGAL